MSQAGLLAYLGSMDVTRVDGDGQSPETIHQQITLALVQHPAVLEASVVPCRMPTGDRRLVAFVVPRPSAECTPEALREFVRERLGPQGTPDKVIFLDALPRSVTGKVDRKRLESGEFAT